MARVPVQSEFEWMFVYVASVTICSLKFIAAVRDHTIPNNRIFLTSLVTTFKEMLDKQSSNNLATFFILSPNFLTFKEPRNRFQGIDAVSLCNLRVT
jgi:hypothetical protein